MRKILILPKTLCMLSHIRVYGLFGVFGPENKRQLQGNCLPHKCGTLILFSVLILVTLLISLASAEIIIIKQPEKLYNLEDIINSPIKVISYENINDFLSMKLICNGKETEIHKEYLVLSQGEEKQISPSIPLTESFIGRSTGTCTIKSSLGDKYVLTNEFRISDLITINLKVLEKTEFAPIEEIIIEGEAKKENGELAEGIVEAKIIGEEISEAINLLETVKNGYFFINFSFPKNTQAGEYVVSINVYEKDTAGDITNRGLANYNIQVVQVPTSLEIVFENKEVEPGTNLKVKAILHDQTGEKIDSRVIISIKDEGNKILHQSDEQTDQFLEFPIEFNQVSKKWKVFAVSNKLTSEDVFTIMEKEDVKIEIINNTLILTNTGNVPYNKEVIVKIGNSSIIVNSSLELNEIKKYVLTAPDGEYQIDVMNDGEIHFTGNVMLTGDVIDVREASGRAVNLIGHPLVWIFIILILAFIAYTIFKKGYKRSFFGYISSIKNKKDNSIYTVSSDSPVYRNSLVNPQTRAELSLSLKGEKQDVALVCLKIKNFSEIESEKGTAKETLQKISNIAEGYKSIVYENQDSLFFIFSPKKTKTFKNDKPAIELAQKIKEILSKDNRLFKQKIKYGISVHYGPIIAKQEKNVFNFMTLGNLSTTAKRIASVSEEDILLSDKIKERTIADVKTEKQERNGVEVYTIKDIKHKEDHSKFISEFVHRQKRLE